MAIMKRGGWMRISCGRVGAAMLALAGACADQSPVAPRGPGSVPATQASSTERTGPGNDRAHAGEAHLRDLAASVPGFGGLTYDRVSGAVVVYMTDVTRGEQVRGVITSYLARMSRGLGRMRLTFRPGDFTFTQLDQWRNAAEAAAADLHGVNWIDLDEDRNRVGLSVTSVQTATEFARRLSAAGVPGRAYYFATADSGSTLSGDECSDPTSGVECPPYEVPDQELYTVEDPGEAPANPGACSPDRLDCYVRAPEAGRIVTYRNNDGRASGCTLGFHGTDGAGNPGFVTAAHCGTSVRYSEGEMRSDPFYHVSPAYGYHVATESIDPPMRDCSTYGAPYAGECLGADAMFARGSAYHISMPVIARPNQRFGPGPTASDTTYTRKIINASNPKIDIDGARAPLPGETVEKIGIATGWVYGTVRRTCETMRLHTAAGSRTRYIYCVATTDYGRRSGDSGAPVFVLDPYYGTATILGVHHGATGTADQITGGAFSDITHIRERLGPIGVAVSPF